MKVFEREQRFPFSHPARRRAVSGNMSCTVRTRKFMTNALLQRKQFVRALCPCAGAASHAPRCADHRRAAPWPR